jgi:hypothetical protein
MRASKEHQVNEVGVYRSFGGCPVLRFISITGSTNPQVIEGTKEA